METQFLYELLGYIASALIVTALMMSKIVKLRIINMIGAAAFSTYGILIGSVPVALMNGIIVVINIYHLFKIYTAKEYFTLLKVSPDSKYLAKFIDFYKDQIRQFQPGYNYLPEKDGVNFFVLRDMVPAGVLIGNLSENGTLTVELDFVTPPYRDFKIGRYLYRDKAEFFREHGVKEIITKPGNPQHNRYLEKIGFRKNGDEMYGMKI